MNYQGTFDAWIAIQHRSLEEVRSWLPRGISLQEPERIPEVFHQEGHHPVLFLGGGLRLSSHLPSHVHEFLAHTSRLGLRAPRRHMRFHAKRKRPEIAEAAAKAVGFPQKVVDFHFPDPMPTPSWAETYPLTSATYLSEEPGKSLLERSQLSRDPRGIDQMPYLSQLHVSIQRNEDTEGKKLHLYLSQKALTDENGKFITRGRYIRLDLLDTLLLFPEISSKSSEFTLTYLHPGKYFLTVIADMDGDGYPSPGDITHPVREIIIEPESKMSVHVNDLTVLN
ncbi:MAG: hypothetical protein AAF191_21500 [Verrucomicrobiota bacterium]